MFNDKKDFQFYLTCNSDFSLSNGSVKTYVANVEIFFNRYDEITQENVNEYYMMLKEERKPSYTNLVLNSLKHYVKFSELNIRVPKELKKTRDDTKEVITYKYLMNDIFDSVDLGDFQSPIQAKAILIFMFHTGLRLNDYRNLHRKDFVFKDDYGCVTVYVQKNQFNKKIFFPKSAFKYFVNYFDTTEEIENAFNLTPSTIRNLINRLDGMVSDIHLHPHLFRASAITHLYSKCDWSVEQIAKLIGISCETIRNYYLNISMDEIEQEYAKKMRGK